MRLSILINTSDPTVNHDYALLWLDTLSHAWTSHDRRGVLRVLSRSTACKRQNPATGSGRDCPVHVAWP